MRRIIDKYRGKKNSFSTQLKLLIICILFLSITTNNITIKGEGFFILNEVNSSLLNEGENNKILCIQDGYLYLNVWNFSEGEYPNFVRIIDVQQPDNPIVVGSIEFDNIVSHGGLSLVDFVISENIAYMLMELWILSHTRYFLTLVNITDPTNPVLLGSSALTAPYLWRVNYSEILSVYKNYAYVSGKFELLIFDCSNQTLPVKVAKYDSTGADIHTKNDFLYLMHNGVRIYSLTDPVIPVLLGELSSSKNSSVGSSVCGNFIVNVFRESGLQSYDCTDPSHPTICWDYKFPRWKVGITGIVHDIDIVEDRLFAGGDRLYIFNIRKPQKPRRIAWIDIGDQNITHIMVADNYLYLTILENITIYSYIENSLERNIGLGIGIPLSVVIGISVVFWWKKKSS